MKDLHWKEIYAVGVPSIDDEHKTLFDAVQALKSAMVRNAGSEEMGVLLRELAATTARHFADEEALLREVQYPGAGLHTVNHQRLMEKINAFVARHIQGAATMNQHAWSFLRDWLVFHVENDDARIGDWLKDRVREQQKKAQSLPKSA